MRYEPHGNPMALKDPPSYLDRTIFAIAGLITTRNAASARRVDQYTHELGVTGVRSERTSTHAKPEATLAA